MSYDLFHIIINIMLHSTKNNHNANFSNKKKIKIKIENTILKSYIWYVNKKNLKYLYLYYI